VHHLARNHSLVIAFLEKEESMLLKERTNLGQVVIVSIMKHRVSLVVSCLYLVAEVFVLAAVIGQITETENVLEGIVLFANYCSMQHRLLVVRAEERRKLELFDIGFYHRQSANFSAPESNSD